MTGNKQKYLALSGGIGGAKLALGLYHYLDDNQLAVVANTGDDFEHLGLYISPDVDTLLYTLSGLNNEETGWGRRDESWNFHEVCRDLGLETWFMLGDRDLAIHIYRTNELLGSKSLSEIVNKLCELLGIRAAVIPMSNEPVRTFVKTSTGQLPFQEYFVKRRCEPIVQEIWFKGADSAELSPGFKSILEDKDLGAVIICPSNPFLSVDPIFSIKNTKKKIKDSGKPVIVVSPIVQGQAIKGPTAKLMKELNLECDVHTIAGIYGDIADAIVIDNTDSASVDKIKNRGMEVFTANIIMNSLEEKINLAKEVIEFSQQLRRTGIL